MASKSKAAVEAAVETEQAKETVSAQVTEQAAEAQVQDNGGDAKEPGRIMYVGPTVPGIGIQNCVYTEIPADAKNVIRENPEIGNLFIPIMAYPDANRMLREERGYIYSAFMKAREIKIKNVENAGASGGVESEERG